MVMALTAQALPQLAGPYAWVIADSIADGHRLTTMEIRCHRFVLAEFNTHRVFSRNSASSRAIPLKKQIERVRVDPAIPLSFPKEQSGMQGGDELDELTRLRAEDYWLKARQDAMQHAQDLSLLGVHKSICNRLLEPFMWHTIIVSSTEWENFFRQRCSPLAQPEIRAVADRMREALDESEPEEMFLGDWHMPYLTLDEERQCRDLGIDPRQVSVARCARVSYLTQDGKRDFDKDVELYQRLVTAEPPHASPLEHVATPSKFPLLGNFDGWQQLRHLVIG